MAQRDPWSPLLAEHQDLRRRLDRLRQVCADGRLGSAAVSEVRALAQGIRDHLSHEELALYPLCERLFGGWEGALSVLRSEHATVARELAQLVSESQGRDDTRVVDRIEALARELDAHFSREEHVLFPLAAARLSPTEAEALARRLEQALGG